MGTDGNKNYMDKDLERELINCVITGQTKYFEILIRKNHAALTKVGESFGFTAAEVEDLIQETHITAYSNLAKFKQESSYATWVTRIMINKCLYTLNKAKRKYEVSETDAGGYMDDHPPMFTALSALETEKTILHNDLKDVLTKALMALPEDYRNVIVLKELEGYGTAEVADLLQITEGNVRIRLKRAKTMLKEKLMEFYDNSSLIERRIINNCDWVVEKVMKKIVYDSGSFRE